MHGVECDVASLKIFLFWDWQFGKFGRDCPCPPVSLHSYTMLSFGVGFLFVCLFSLIALCSYLILSIERLMSFRFGNIFCLSKLISIRIFLLFLLVRCWGSWIYPLICLSFSLLVFLFSESFLKIWDICIHCYVMIF